MELGIDLLIRWAHTLPAVLLVGGTWFMVLALHPSVSELEDPQRAELKARLRSRWAKVVMVCAGLLLLSGLGMFVKMALAFRFPEGYFHPVGGLKLLLALVVFFIASLLTGKSANAEKFRENEGRWLKINALLALAIVMLGGLLRVAERTPKDEGTADTTQARITLSAENVRPGA